MHRNGPGIRVLTRLWFRSGLQVVVTCAALGVLCVFAATANEEQWAAAIAGGDQALAAGDVESAIERFQQARELARALPPGDARQTETLLRLARAYRSQGDFAKPEGLYADALKIAEATYGSTSGEFAEYVNEVGRYFHARRKYRHAEERYKEAFAIRVKVFGREHAAVAESINNLAILYENESRYDKAEVYYTHALDIREKTLGRDHPDTVVTLEHFSRLLFKMNRAEEARPMQDRARIVRSQWVAEAYNDQPPAEVYRLGDGVIPPRLKERTEPEYSEEARIARHEGSVVLQAVITPEGSAGNFKLVRSLGLGLDEKAVKAVRTWRFEPGRRGNGAVAVQANLEITFRIL